MVVSGCIQRLAASIAHMSHFLLCSSTVEGLQSFSPEAECALTKDPDGGSENIPALFSHRYSFSLPGRSDRRRPLCQAAYCRMAVPLYHITISKFDTMLRDFFLGFIKIHVLYHAALEPIYGMAMIAELARHGYDLSPGTLYPLLHSLEEQGYLVHMDRVVEGRVRKYYVITDKGRAALLDAKQKIAELVHEVLEEVDEARLPELPPFSYDETEEG